MRKQTRKCKIQLRLAPTTHILAFLSSQCWDAPLCSSNQKFLGSWYHTESYTPRGGNRLCDLPHPSSHIPRTSLVSPSRTKLKSKESIVQAPVTSCYNRVRKKGKKGVRKKAKHKVGAWLTEQATLWTLALLLTITEWRQRRPLLCS